LIPTVDIPGWCLEFDSRHAGEVVSGLVRNPLGIPITGWKGFKPSLGFTEGKVLFLLHGDTIFSRQVKLIRGLPQVRERITDCFGYGVCR